MSDPLPELDWIQAASAVCGVAREFAAQAEDQRHLPKQVADAFVRRNLYRLAAPELCGGADASPATQMRVVEIISAADGSAGWNLMIGIETFGLVGPSMATCLDVIADPNVVMASSTATVGDAVQTDEGWLISGQWQFVSGVHNAHVFGATVKKIVAGEPEDSTRYYAILTEGQFEIVDTWHVSGLRGSGSHDVRVHDILVSDERVVATLGKGSMRSKQLALPLGVRLTFNKVAVGFGIARAAIAAFMDLTGNKTPHFSRQHLRQRPFAQRAIANAEIRLRSARAAVYEQAEHLWTKAQRQDSISLHDKAIAHALASDAAQAAVDTVEHVVRAAGTTANRLDQLLERLARDVRVIRQHATVAPHHIDDVGAVLLGNEPTGILLM